MRPAQWLFIPVAVTGVFLTWYGYRNAMMVLSGAYIALYFVLRGWRRHDNS